jgi:hypothetical protein
MIELSEKTQKLISVLYKSENEQKAIGALLVQQCADNIPFCEGSSPEEMERIRFAVLKLASEGQRIDACIKEAAIDWRDLFMSAGFGYDVKAHEQWATPILARFKK